MNIFETISVKFLGKNKNQNQELNKNLSNSPTDKAIEQDLTSMESARGFSILDELENQQSSGNMFDDNNNLIDKAVKDQDDLINEYRRISRLPEISDAVDEIINEAVFEPNSNDVFYLDFDTGISDNLKETCIKQFNIILEKLNVNYNADMLFRRWYIDGRLALNLVYKNNDITAGIQSINLLSPYGFYFDSKADVWKYHKFTDTSSSMFNGEVTQNEDREYSREEIVYIDSGIYEKGVILSHLHPIIKISNQLQTLEDLLIPLRFSRSISRRVFNIDVGDLSYAKGMQAVKQIRDNFKYKKYYDVANGRISNSSTVASIVEDYFLPKRSESKGSSIDVLEETGNLGETGDLEYFQAKLAKSLKIPLNRISSADGGGMFDFTGTQIENSEKKFFAFIHRLRNRFGMILLDILRAQLIATNTMHMYEFNHYKPKMFIKWSKTNNYLQRQHIELFRNKLDLYKDASEYIGELYSKDWLLTNILGFSEQELIEMQQSISDEAEDNKEKDINNSVNKVPDNIFDDENLSGNSVEDTEGTTSKDINKEDNTETIADNSEKSIDRPKFNIEK